VAQVKAGQDINGEVATASGRLFQLLSARALADPGRPDGRVLQVAMDRAAEERREAEHQRDVAQRRIGPIGAQAPEQGGHGRVGAGPLGHADEDGDPEPEPEQGQHQEGQGQLRPRARRIEQREHDDAPAP